MSFVFHGKTRGASIGFTQAALVLSREKSLAIIHLTAHDKGLLFYMNLFHYHLLVMRDERVIRVDHAQIALILEAHTKRFTFITLSFKRVFGIWKQT
jgi:hypothetical protein